MSRVTLKYISIKNLERFIEAQDTYYAVSAMFSPGSAHGAVSAEDHKAWKKALEEYNLAATMLASDACTTYKAINLKECEN